MSVPSWTIQHDPEIWGDPNTYRPERWLGAESKDLHKYLLTFGKGPRACVSSLHSESALMLNALSRSLAAISPTWRWAWFSPRSWFDTTLTFQMASWKQRKVLCTNLSTWLQICGAGKLELDANYNSNLCCMCVQQVDINVGNRYAKQTQIW